VGNLLTSWKELFASLQRLAPADLRGAQKAKSREES
jgi:hypothetical protein